MSVSARVIEKYGESMTIDGTPAKGFISAVDKNSPDTEAVLPAGVRGTARYRLITGLPLPAEGADVICLGREYVILRVEPVRIAGKLSHNECLLRLKGGGAGA